MNASAAAVMLAGGRWLVVLLGVGLGLAGAGLGFSDLSDSTFYGGGSVVGYWPYFLIALAGPVGAGATVFRRAWGAAVVAVASGGLLVASVRIWQSGAWEYRAPLSRDSVEVGLSLLVAATLLAASVSVAMARAARDRPAR